MSGKNLHVHSAHRQRKSLGCEHKKGIEKRWRITCADIRPGVYGPLRLRTSFITKNINTESINHCSVMQETKTIINKNL